MISKNGAALVILALSVLGLEVEENAVVEMLSALGTLVSFALMVYNQFARRDVEGFFFKK